METGSHPVAHDPVSVRRIFLRAAALAGLGGMVGAGCLVVAYAMSPRVIIEMDRDLPRRVVSGLYGAESAGQRTFAWTARQAEFRFRGLRRESAWACRLALRGGRGDAALQPVAELAVDGLTLARLQATDEFQEIEVTAPRRPQAGLTLTVKSSSVVVPPGDPRELGLQLDWLTCRPVDAAFTSPTVALRAAATGGAVLGAVLGFQSATPDRGGMAAAACFGTGHSALLRDRPYSTFPEVASAAAIWIAIAAVAVLTLLIGAPEIPLAGRSNRLALHWLRGLSQAPRAASSLEGRHRCRLPCAPAAGRAVGRLLLHPGDAERRTFLYAIGLYVVATPWTALTSDYVTLLRTVVCVVEAIAGALLYAAVVRCGPTGPQGRSP